MPPRRLPRDHAPSPAPDTAATASAKAKRRRLRGPNLSTWTAEEIALLGVLPDKAIAAQTGRRRGLVAAARRKLGLPPVAGCGGRKAKERE